MDDNDKLMKPINDSAMATSTNATAEFLKKPYAAALLGGFGLLGALGLFLGLGKGDRMNCKKTGCHAYGRVVDVLHITTVSLCDVHHNELNSAAFARDGEKQVRRYDLDRHMALAMLTNRESNLDKIVEKAKGDLEAHFKFEDKFMGEQLPAWLAIPAEKPSVDDPSAETTPVGEGG